MGASESWPSSTGRPVPPPSKPPSQQMSNYGALTEIRTEGSSWGQPSGNERCTTNSCPKYPSSVSCTKNNLSDMASDESCVRIEGKGFSTFGAKDRMNLMTRVNILA